MNVATVLILSSMLFATPALAEEMKALPPLKAQPSPQAVVDEHIDALNKCDWDRLMAQYPPEVLIVVADGAAFSGREEVGKLFAGFCQSKADGGLNGLQFKELSTVAVDGTLNVIWEADADFLAEPYKGADAYVTKDGFMYAQVTTFDGSKLKFK
jgi:SnoaL-like domain